MIEGVTILNQEAITELPSWFGLVFGIGLLAIVIIAILLMCVCNYDIVGLIVLLGGMLLFAIILFSTTEQVPTDRYRYTVTIDETVSFKEVHERYDVIDQAGKMWILEDKEENNE